MAETVYQLRYQVKLENAAVFATVNGDPNIVKSDGYVPGSAVWGALAAAYIRQELQGNGDTAHTDPNFRQWFLQEGLRCLNAYPVILKRSKEFARTLPMPLSFRHAKGEEKDIIAFYDFAFAQDEEDEEVRAAKERAGSKFYVLDGSTVVPYSSRTRWMYHTTRKNRKQGRADAESGAVFVYEALDGGQIFEGCILGSSDVLTQVADLLQKDNDIWLGRSKATQYGGGGKLNIVDTKPQPYSREIEAAACDTTQIVVTLTSHLLARTDATGYVSAQFPTDELARALNPDTPPQLDLLRSFARRETVGGYVAKWGLPRPQWSAFSAGSVFVFEANATISADAITQAEAYGIGLRVGEGYGRFVINAHGRKATLTRTDPDKTKLELGSISSEFTRIITHIAQDDIRQKVRADAQRVASAFAEDADKLPTSALLGRLTLIVQHTDMTELGEVILAVEGDPRYSRTASLKDIARRQLERCRRKKRDGSVEALTDHVRDVAAEKVLTGDILKGTLGEKENSVALQAGYDVGNDVTFQADLAKMYLLTLLAALSRSVRMRGDQ